MQCPCACLNIIVVARLAAGIPKHAPCPAMLGVFQPAIESFGAVILGGVLGGGGVVCVGFHDISFAGNPLPSQWSLLLFIFLYRYVCACSPEAFLSPPPRSFPANSGCPSGARAPTAAARSFAKRKPRSSHASRFGVAAVAAMTATERDRCAIAFAAILAAAAVLVFVGAAATMAEADAASDRVGGGKGFCATGGIVVVATVASRRWRKQCFCR